MAIIDGIPKFGKVMDNHDWESDPTINRGHHPIIMVGNRKQLIDFHTKKVIATAEDGYEFCWLHDHPHVCPEGFKPEGYIDHGE